MPWAAPPADAQAIGPSLTAPTGRDPGHMEQRQSSTVVEATPGSLQQPDSAVADCDRDGEEVTMADASAYSAGLTGHAEQPEIASPPSGAARLVLHCLRIAYTGLLYL